MEKIHFSCNWNGKLNTKTFTTIRKHDHFEEGKKYCIFLENEYQFEAVVLIKKFIYLHEISTTRAYLDTGYDRATTWGILKKMYPNTDWTRESLVWLLLKRV